MISLLDGDILLYRIGHTTESDNIGIALARLDDLVDSILLETDATEFEVWLSDNKEGNFRYAIYPKYKANRKQPRPVHYEALKEHLVKEWEGQIAVGMEADDALGIAQDKFSLEKTCICSIDKDLLQIPGTHYNFVKKEWNFIGDWQGLQWFYKQLLQGDMSDNIYGCSGIGKVKAGRIIDSIGSSEGERALFEAVIQTYKEREKGQTEQEILDHILLAGRLLKIKQERDEQEWVFPLLKAIAVSTSQFTAPPQGEIIQFTAPTTRVMMNGFLPHGT